MELHQNKKNIYIVKNNDNCYVIMDKLKVFCEKIPPQKATQFKIIILNSLVYKNGNIIKL